MSKQQDVIAELLKNIRDAELLRNNPDKDLNSEEGKNYGEEQLSQLKAACSNFLRKESFEVGQLVKWKENLKNRKLPYKNQPAIVVAILDEPVISNEQESGSPYFLEPLDIILGIIVDDNTFMTFYYDSRRFEAY
jgi:hypothetical protein